MSRTMTRWMPKLPRTIAQFEQEMEDMVGRFFGEEGNGAILEFVPAANLAETDDKYEVCLEAPGMKAGDFKVEMKSGQLWISGEKKEEKEEKGKTWHRVESRYGEFRRVMTLPAAVQEDKIQAEYKDGMLKVIAPKAEAVKPKQIPVKA